MFSLTFLQNLVNGWTICFPGTANNAGAILVLGRDLIVVPKLIHPLPPQGTSPSNSPDGSPEDTWMQVRNLLTFPSFAIQRLDQFIWLPLLIFRN